MIRDEWLEGITCLFSLRRVKQVVQSVNDPKSFLDMLNALLQMLTAPGLKMEVLQTITASLNQEPFYLLLLLLQLYFKQPVEETLQQMGRDSTPFFASEIKQIFSSFDPSGVCKAACKQLTDTLAQE